MEQLLSLIHISYVVPYKGKKQGEMTSVSVNYIPLAKNVKAVRKSTSEVRVTWSAVPGADSYTCLLYTSSYK